MSRFHNNPDAGPMPCTAQEGNCPYGSDAPHFSSKNEAQVAFEESLEKEINPLQSVRRVKKADYLNSKKDLARKLDSMNFDEVEKFSNSSKANHKALDSIISDRETTALKHFNKLQSFDPKNRGLPNSLTCDKATLRSLRKDYEAYRNKTAELVEAHTESKFYNSPVRKLDDDSFVGQAVKIENFEPNSEEWLKARYNRVGGSDVSLLASIELEDPNKIPGYIKGALGRVEISKIVEPDSSDVKRNYETLKVNRQGALYRGTVWEKRVRDSYLEDNPEVTVYDTKAQYKHPERDWQVINLDGVISNRPDGKPNGLLEIKTGSDPEQWKDGVPIGYRAQVLYCLNTTGLEFADVRARINDSQDFTYRIHKDDEIKEGSGIKMESYIKNEVTSWFEGLKSERATKTV